MDDKRHFCLSSIQTNAQYLLTIENCLNLEKGPWERGCIIMRGRHVVAKHNIAISSDIEREPRERSLVAAALPPPPPSLCLPFLPHTQTF